MSQIYTRVFTTPQLPESFPNEHPDLYSNAQANFIFGIKIDHGGSPNQSDNETKCDSSQSDSKESSDPNLSLYSSSYGSVSIEEGFIDRDTHGNSPRGGNKFAPSITKSKKKALSKIQEVDSMAYGSEPELWEVLEEGGEFGLLGSQKNVEGVNAGLLMLKRCGGSQSGRVIGTRSNFGSEEA